MNKIIDFGYEKEHFSFYNKKFTIYSIIVSICLLILGIIISDLMLMLEILIVISIFFLVLGIKTYIITKEKSYFKKYGKKCEGIIRGMKIDEAYNYANDDFEDIDDINLVIEYMNPYTNCLARFVAGPLRGNPYSHLKSLKVTVYVLEDGRAYATNFKKIKKLEEAVKYHDKELKEKLNQEKSEATDQND